MIETLLGHIDRIYDLQLEINIEEFLIDQEDCLSWSGEPASEAVLVTQGGETEELRVGLYLTEETLSRLKELKLTSSLAAEDFTLLCSAIEEVSHFAYLVWNASRDKQVTRLELELQGEVDKFITAVLLLARQNRGRVPMDLLDRLFGGFELREGLDASHRERYLAASSFARNYCFSLVRRFLRQARLMDLIEDLRLFYRLSLCGKIGHISRAVYSF
jgi:hypothetical protein